MIRVSEPVRRQNLRLELNAEEGYRFEQAKKSITAHGVDGCYRTRVEWHRPMMLRLLRPVNPCADPLCLRINDALAKYGAHAKPELSEEVVFNCPCIRFSSKYINILIANSLQDSYAVY